MQAHNASSSEHEARNTARFPHAKHNASDKSLSIEKDICRGKSSAQAHSRQGRIKNRGTSRRDCNVLWQLRSLSSHPALPSHFTCTEVQAAGLYRAVELFERYILKKWQYARRWERWERCTQHSPALSQIAAATACTVCSLLPAPALRITKANKFG